MSILKVGVIILLHFSFYNLGAGTTEETIVNLKLGKVQGSILKTYNEKEFFAFRGIPYAKPPIGKLRFKRPEKLTDSWNSQTFDATIDGPVCVQYDSLQKKIFGQEDCLVLNVYTPEIPKDISKVDKKAVMVFIHGGGFNLGTGNSAFYGPKKILDHDVVLVTINYRLSVFGFLSTQDEASPGNYGLLDQVMALEWIQENIEAFDGDPNKVTIFGESAGGASVSYHLLSELSTGLFKSAIVMSGPPLASWGIDYKPNEVVEKFASLTGCSMSNSNDGVECFRQLSLDDITPSMSELGEKLLAPFRPVVDGYFLKEDPFVLYKSGRIANRVPLIFGKTKNEGLIFYAMHFGHLIPELSKEVIKKIVGKIFITDDENIPENDVNKLIKNQYFKTANISDKEVVKNILIKIFSDGMMDAPFYYNLELYLKSGIEPFVYSFDYVTDHSILKMFGVEKSEPTHADDLYFLLDSQFFFPFDYTKPNDEHEKKFLELFINFAKTNNPTPESYESSFKWLPAHNDNIAVCHLDNPVTLKMLKIDNTIINFWMKTMPESLKLLTTKKDEL